MSEFLYTFIWMCAVAIYLCTKSTAISELRKSANERCNYANDEYMSIERGKHHAHIHTHIHV